MRMNKDYLYVIYAEAKGLQKNIHKCFTVFYKYT